MAKERQDGTSGWAWFLVLCMWCFFILFIICSLAVSFFLPEMDTPQGFPVGLMLLLGCVVLSPILTIVLCKLLANKKSSE